MALLGHHKISSSDVQKCSTCAKQNKTAREIFAVNSLEIIRSSFLLLILIKNAITNIVTANISLHMVCLENPENENSEIAANTSEAGTSKYYRFSKFCKIHRKTPMPESYKKLQDSGTGIFL